MTRTTIPVDAETKARLSERKRKDETWDEFLLRITDEEEPINIGAWSDDEAERAREQIRKSREEWD